MLPGKGAASLTSDAVLQELGQKIIDDKATGFFSPKAEGITEAPTQLTNLVNASDDPAVFGSTSGADTNDPAFYPATDWPALIVPSVATAGVLATHVGATDDTEIIQASDRVYFLDEPATSVFLAGTNSSHFALIVNSIGALTIRHLNDDFGILIGNTAAPSSVPSFANRWVWVRAKLTRETALCEYWYSYDDTDDVDAVKWVSLGSVVGTGAGETLASAQLAARRVGCHTTTANGQLHYSNAARIEFDSLVSDFKASDNVNGSQTSFSSGGLTWAIQEAGSTYTTRWVQAGEITVQLDGVDDYIALPVSCQPTITPTTGGYTVLLLASTKGTTTRGVFGAGSANFEGVSMYMSVGSAPVATVRDSGAGAATSVLSGGHNDGKPLIIGGVFDSGDVVAYSERAGFDLTPGDYSGLADINYGTATFPRIGTSAGGTGSVFSPTAMEFYAVAVFQEALFDDEIVAVGAYLKGLAE